MALIDETDIQTFLPPDKLNVGAAQEDTDQLIEDAERIIRGMLAGYVDPLELATWVDPTSTPTLIRAIGGRLAAARLYRSRFGTAGLDDPEYAQVLYNEAMFLLNGIIAGTIEIPGVDTPPAGDLSVEDFYPNDPDVDPPSFTKSMVF